MISWKFKSKSQMCFALMFAIVKLNSDSLNWNIHFISIFPLFSICWNCNYVSRATLTTDIAEALADFYKFSKWSPFRNLFPLSRPQNHHNVIPRESLGMSFEEYPIKRQKKGGAARVVGSRGKLIFSLGDLISF